jgi:hypothetical protein
MFLSLLSPARASERSARRARRDARRDETLLFLGRSLGPQVPVVAPLEQVRSTSGGTGDAIR